MDLTDRFYSLHFSVALTFGSGFALELKIVHLHNGDLALTET